MFAGQTTQKAIELSQRQNLRFQSAAQIDRGLDPDRAGREGSIEDIQAQLSARVIYVHVLAISRDNDTKMTVSQIQSRG
jgi:hypothetical protein